MQSEIIDINKIKNNKGQIPGLPANPRFIKDDSFKRLIKSIQDDPEMLDLREVIVYNHNNEYIAIMGNMRLRAMKELGYKNVNVKILPINTPVEKLRAYTIKDNVPFGENNYDLLANEWDVDELNEWGLDIPGVNDKNESGESDDGEIKFSKEIDLESNYIVLKFNTDIDWLYAKTILELPSTYSQRSNGKPWVKGIGRVVDGIDAFKKIKGENEN